MSSFKRKKKTKVSSLPKVKLPPRRKPTLAEQVLILARQAKCALSGEPLVDYANIQWDHFQERALGGKDTDENWQAVLKAAHDKKTFGTKATSAGSSIHKVSHTKQIIAKGKDHVVFMAGKVGNKGHNEFLEHMAKAGKRVVPRRKFP